ncbi:hypothetical protein AWE51_25595 [Aquimarina aggregata]|uniref:Uncharacterized protein n=1 Tax=Aquimarina aggregata TaxID=1642818 RepID=A0A162F9W4_9FLAO|nr:MULTISPECIES: hypothetical protein [Aquimarina]KZS40076.1 hypothetical protein AWE51_25595 [Aquimarina aggregata]
MKKKKISVLVVFLIVQLAFTQSIKLVGPRNLNLDNWDVPIPRVLYSDDNGTIYHYLTEASQPRTNELLRFDESLNRWINVTDNSFLIGNGAGPSEGVPQPDGSIIVVSRTFGGNAEHTVHTLFPDGNFEEFGGPTGLSGNNAGAALDIEKAPNGDIYYSHSTISVGVNHWNGEEWIPLPNVVDSTLGGSSSLEIDEDGALYVLHSNNTTDNTAQLEVYDGEKWNTIYNSEDNGVVDSNLYVVSSKEIYISYTIGDEAFVVLFDGANATKMGNPVKNLQTTLNSGELLKSTLGKLYLTTYDSDAGFYVFNNEENDWEEIENTISDRGSISGFRSRLLELNGSIYNTFNESNGITTVKYTPSDSTQLPNENRISDFGSFRVSRNVQNLFFTSNAETEASLSVYDIIRNREVLSTTINVSEGINNFQFTRTGRVSIFIARLKDLNSSQQELIHRFLR